MTVGLLYEFSMFAFFYKFNFNPENICSSYDFMCSNTFYDVSLPLQLQIYCQHIFTLIDDKYYYVTIVSLNNRVTVVHFLGKTALTFRELKRKITHSWPDVKGILCKAHHTISGRYISTHVPYFSLVQESLSYNVQYTSRDQIYISRIYKEPLKIKNPSLHHRVHG